MDLPTLKQKYGCYLVEHCGKVWRVLGISHGVWRLKSVSNNKVISVYGAGIQWIKDESIYQKTINKGK